MSLQFLGDMWLMVLLGRLDDQHKFPEPLQDVVEHAKYAGGCGW